MLEKNEYFYVIDINITHVNFTQTEHWNKEYKYMGNVPVVDETKNKW
jgi:hypothetical protein